MAIDASIPLQAVNQVQPPNLIGQATQGLQLKSLVDEDTQRKQQIQQQQALMDAYKTTDTSTDEGKQELIKKVSQINPQMGQKLSTDFDTHKKTQAQTAEANAKAQESQMQVNDAKMQNIGDVANDILSNYNSIASKAGPQAAWQQVQPVIQQRIQSMQLEKGPDGKPLYSVDELKQFSSVQSPQQLETAASHSHNWFKQKDQQRADAELGEREKHDRAEERNQSAEVGLRAQEVGLRRQEVQGGGKPPEGYRRSADGNLEYIPGGPADPKTKAGAMGGRQEVVFNRIMTGATESAKDLGNIVNLPMSADRGMFGGRTQGGGLMSATKEDMANKMTGQEAQSYNVRVSGITRNLAAIEASGLAPAGSLTHSMDSVTFKEGDTNRTKLEKLAQSRQIVEAGLEVALNTPGITKDQHEQAQKTLDSIKKSIPFTIEDLDKLSDVQTKNPKATLKDVIGGITAKPEGDIPSDGKSSAPTVSNW